MPTLVIDTNNREDLELHTPTNFVYKLNYPIIFRKDSTIELQYCSICTPVDNSNLYFTINITGFLGDTFTNDRTQPINFVIPCNSAPEYRTTFYGKNMFDNVSFVMSEQSVQRLEIKILNSIGEVLGDSNQNLIILKYN